MFTCDKCDYQISSNKIMKIHTRTFHNRDETHNCSICGYQSLKKESLTRHKKIVHDGVKVKYPCKQCGQEFTQKGNLARHQMAAHEGVKYP